MTEITADTIREVLATPDPMLEALSLMLKELAADLVKDLGTVLSILGADVADLPGEYLVQAVLVESDKVLRPVTRENWIKIFDGYEQVKAVLDANPDIRDEVAARWTGETEAAKSDSLLDGNF